MTLNLEPPASGRGSAATRLRSIPSLNRGHGVSNSTWTQGEIDYANKIAKRGGFASDALYRVNRKYKNGRTQDELSALIASGTVKIKGKFKKEIAEQAEQKKQRIITLKEAGHGRKDIADMVGCHPSDVSKVCREHFGSAPKREAKPPLDEFSHLYVDDPIKDIGFVLTDLRANGCHYPVARWPKKYPQQRFCGEPRKMDGQYFASAYCDKHHALCHRQVNVAEAAE